MRTLPARSTSTMHRVQLGVAFGLYALCAVLAVIAIFRPEAIRKPATLWTHASGVVTASYLDADGQARIRYEYPLKDVRRKEALDRKLAAGEITEASYQAEMPEIRSSDAVYHASVETGQRLSPGELVARYTTGRTVTVYQHPTDPATAVLVPGGWTWFAGDRTNVCLAVLAFTGMFFHFLSRAGRGKELYLRRVAGLDALEEAIGRATEMGRPVLYVPGLDDIESAPTIASMVVLGHVASITAEYDTPIIVPCRFAVVLSIAEETVREAYIVNNKADRYNPDNIRYLSGEQFAYTSSINGIMLREKPAANLYMGAFMAESLILVETGFSAGSIQVAGTPSVMQIPFFIVACDYTLIGEEYYAASAYLSRAPDVLSSIKTADYFKAATLAVLLAGCLLKTFWPELMLRLSLLF
ncbi:hypothetical protein HS125_02240 [bacterium]|nr:hypothetical protein [bacterium]